MAEEIGRKSQRLYSEDELLNHSKFDRATVGYFRDSLIKRLNESGYKQCRYDKWAIAFYYSDEEDEENSEDRQGPIILEKITTSDEREGLRIVIRPGYKAFHETIENAMKILGLPIKVYNPKRNKNINIYGFLYEGEKGNPPSRKEPGKKELPTWDLGTPIALPESKELVFR